LAVQNEFSQRDLGAATAATQLFRNLGSTVGVAVLGGILTAGIIATLGNVQKIPYIEVLSKQPQSEKSQIFDFKKVDADTALTLNTRDARKQVNQGIEKGLAKAQAQALASAQQKIAASGAPETLKPQLEAKAKAQISQKFTQTKADIHAKQASFSHDVKYAFSNSLRIIFYLAAGLMTMAFMVALFIREKPLRHGPEGSVPGVA
jgi:hypothetical protein